ncbi:MAG: hypothetical protein ACRDTF_19005 [Pseudonocardiaceae bacterium]
MSSGGVRVFAAVVSAVVVVVVYVVVYLLMGGHGGHEHAGLAALPAVSPPPVAGAEYPS